MTLRWLVLATIAVGYPALPLQHRTERQSSALPCFCKDSLAASGGRLTFGSFLRDSVTQDLVGTEVTFVVTGPHWTGSIRDAKGELGSARPLIDVRFDRVEKRLAFRYQNAPDTASFAGRVSCDSIWGTWKPFRGVSLARGLPRAHPKGN